MVTDRLSALSLGAGVQSTTVLLLALDGTLPPFDAVVFADTGDEPAAVYEHRGRRIAHFSVPSRATS